MRIMLRQEHRPTFFRIDVVRPPAVDVHEVEEARAVREFGEHADRQEFLITSSGLICCHGITSGAAVRARMRYYSARPGVKFR